MIVVLLIIIGFAWGYVSYRAGEYHVYSISIYACHDGCSIATKNKTTGFLTNDTWDCWDKCIEYIKEIKTEGKK